MKSLANQIIEKDEISCELKNLNKDWLFFLEEAIKLNTIKANLNKFRIKYNNGCPSSNVPTSLDYDYDLAELNRLFLDVATKLDTMDSLKSFSLIYLKKLYKKKCRKNRIYT